MIQEILNNAIYAYAIETGRECTVIMMHPYTWQKLVTEVIGNNSGTINLNDPNLRYMGMKVYRSWDMNEDTFIVK